MDAQCLRAQACCSMPTSSHNCTGQLPEAFSCSFWMLFAMFSAFHSHWGCNLQLVMLVILIWVAFILILLTIFILDAICNVFRSSSSFGMRLATFSAHHVHFVCCLQWFSALHLHLDCYLQLILLFILIWVARQRLPATPATQNGPEPYTVVYRLISSVQNEIVLNALIRLT